MATSSPSFHDIGQLSLGCPNKSLFSKEDKAMANNTCRHCFCAHGLLQAHRRSACETFTAGARSTLLRDSPNAL